MKNTILLPTPREQRFGFCYCLFANLVLPSVVSFLSAVFGRQLHILALNMACFAVNFAVLTCVFRRFLLKSLDHFVENWGKILLTALLGLLLHLLCAAAMAALFSKIAPEFYNRNDSAIAAMADKSFLLTFIGTVILVPVAEECMFRGAIFGLIYPKNRLFAYFFSAVFFSLVHIAGYFGVMDGKILLLSFLQYLPAGLILAAAYEKSDSIFAPIFIHMAVNALGMLALR